MGLLTPAAYKYTLVSKRTDAHANADALSKLPLSETMRETPIPVELILTLEHVQYMLVTDQQIRTWTIQDPLLKHHNFLFNKVGLTTVSNQSLNHTSHVERSYAVLKAVSYGILKSHKDISES